MRHSTRAMLTSRPERIGIRRRREAQQKRPPVGGPSLPRPWILAMSSLLLRTACDAYDPGREVRVDTSRGSPTNFSYQDAALPRLILAHDW